MRSMLQTKKLENKPNCIWLCDDSGWKQSVQVFSREILKPEISFGIAKYGLSNLPNLTVALLSHITGVIQGRDLRSGPGIFKQKIRWFTRALEILHQQHQLWERLHSHRLSNTVKSISFGEKHQVTLVHIWQCTSYIDCINAIECACSRMFKALLPIMPQHQGDISSVPNSFSVHSTNIQHTVI